MRDKTKLFFGQGNSKLSKAIATFSLPAGWSCPFAKECLSRSNRLTGKLVDGKHCRFRCFAASEECRKTSVRHSRWHNFELLKQARSVEKMAMLIQKSLPFGANLVRTHVSGDYFREEYFLAWLNVALNNPAMTFYGYTKALPYLVEYRKYIPPNFRFAASKGGTHDHLIGKHRLRFSEVVYSLEEAEAKGLPVDHDDTHVFEGRESFALLIHGTQPPGTEASKAWVSLMRQGIGGYSKTNSPRHALIPVRPFTMRLTLKSGELYLPFKAAQTKFKKVYA